MNTDSSTPSPSVYSIGIGLGLLAAGAATAFFAWYALITTAAAQTATSIFGAVTPTEDPTSGAKAFLVVGGIASIIGALILIIGIVQLAQGVDYLVRRTVAADTPGAAEDASAEVAGGPVPVSPEPLAP